MEKPPSCIPPRAHLLRPICPSTPSLQTRKIEGGVRVSVSFSLSDKWQFPSWVWITLGRGLLKRWWLPDSLCIFSFTVLESSKLGLFAQLLGRWMTLEKSCSPFMLQSFVGFFFSLLPSLSLCYWCFLFVFETWSSVAQVDLNLAPSQRMALHNWFSCFRLSDAEIRGVNHHNIQLLLSVFWKNLGSLALAVRVVIRWPRLARNFLPPTTGISGLYHCAWFNYEFSKR